MDTGPQHAGGQPDTSVMTLSPEMEQIRQKLSAAKQPPEAMAKATAEAEARERKKLVAGLIGEMGPRYAPDRVSLERFEVYHPLQRDVLQRVKDLAERLPEVVQAGEGLIFYGTVGSGKDHLMAALLHQAAAKHGIEPKWINGLELYGTMRDRMDQGQKEAEYIRQLVGPPILAISDPLPPLRDPTAWNVETLYRLIDARYRRLRSTWVTMNAASAEDADARLSAQVFDRLRDSAHLFRCCWPSYRIFKEQA